MKAIFIIILTLITIEVAAQNHLIGITGGANWTMATFSNISFGQTEGRYGGYGGITYEYFLKKGFSIGADITYHQRGFTTDLEITTSEKSNLPLIMTICLFR